MVTEYTIFAKLYAVDSQIFYINDNLIFFSFVNIFIYKIHIHNGRIKRMGDVYKENSKLL